MAFFVATEEFDGKKRLFEQVICVNLTLLSF
jgi:hypothetical protein